MAMKRTDFTKYLLKLGYEVFWDNYDEIGSVWEQLVDEEDTDKPYVERMSMSGLDDLEEKGEDEPIKYDKMADGWPILGKVRTFAKGIAFSMELYEDTQIEQLFSQAVASWSKAYTRTRDRFYARFFNEGALLSGSDVFDNSIPGVKLDPTGKFIYDGKPFFADAGNPHPLRHSPDTIVNYAPLPIDESVSLDVATQNLIDVYQKMTIDNAKDEKGDEILVTPDTIVIPPALKFRVNQILNSDYFPKLDSTPSAINPLKGMLDVVVWPRLKDPTGWFLVERKRGLKALNRKDVTIDVWEDPETKQIKASVVCRFGGYVEDVRYTFGCNIAQS